MKRKIKYLMRTYLGDSVFTTELTLTKRQFEETFNTLKSQYDHMEDTKEFGAEYTEQILRDADTSRDTLYKFSYGVNEIYLYKLEAKDGYYWE